MNFAPLALYTAAFLAYAWHFTERQPAVGRSATALLVFGALAHTFVIGMQTMEVGHVPVTGATFNPARRTWQPTYADPFSERLPPLKRVDVSLSRLRRLSSRTILVCFAEVENLFDRDNLYEYTYNADFSRRVGVRSLFKRSLYVGASLTHTGN